MNKNYKIKILSFRTVSSHRSGIGMDVNKEFNEMLDTLKRYDIKILEEYLSPEMSFKCSYRSAYISDKIFRKIKLFEPSLLDSRFVEVLSLDHESNHTPS